MANIRHAAGKRPDRRKPPKPPQLRELRKTELIGLTDDGRMVLWDTGMVQPLDRFPMTRAGSPWIDSGHYVIDWKGHAITVHCSALANGSIGVLFMCSKAPTTFMAREEVEAMLIGKVIPDPEEEAKILRALQRLCDAVVTRQDTPARQRGRIS